MTMPPKKSGIVCTNDETDLRQHDSVLRHHLCGLQRDFDTQ